MKIRSIIIFTLFYQIIHVSLSYNENNPNWITVRDEITGRAHNKPTRLTIGDCYRINGSQCYDLCIIWNYYQNSKTDISTTLEGSREDCYRKRPACYIVCTELYQPGNTTTTTTTRTTTRTTIRTTPPPPPPPSTATTTSSDGTKAKQVAVAKQFIGIASNVINVGLMALAVAWPAAAPVIRVVRKFVTFISIILKMSLPWWRK